MSDWTPAYSSTRRAGDLVFVSGQFGTEDGHQPDVARETTVALKRLVALVEAEGGKRSDVVRCTVYLEDMADWPAMNASFGAFFEPPYPARTAVGGQLALGARVEIDGIAVLAEAGAHG